MCYLPQMIATNYVAGYCAWLDMTVRGGEVGSLRKSLDSYTVLGPWLTTSGEVGDSPDLLIHLEVAYEFYSLLPGDDIMAGTPAGVGPVVYPAI